MAKARSRPKALHLTSVQPFGDGDRRESQRFTTVFRVGKMVSGQVEQLCLIRNISDGGLMARVGAAHSVGQRVEIELKSDTRLAGSVVWVAEDHIGVNFDQAVEIADVLAARTTACGLKVRPPRIEIATRARLRIGKAYWRVDVCDLSQGGVKIDIDDPLAPGDDAVITIDGLDPVPAVVRWWKDDRAGLSFVAPIPFDALVAWVAQRSAGIQPDNRPRS